MTATTGDRDARLPLPTDGSSHKAYRPELSAALMNIQAAVIRHCTLDAVTMELIRTRCAHVHDCRVCSHVRYEPARAAGADEDVLAKVDRYESSDLGERHKVVLRLADAHIFGQVPDTLPDEVGRHLSPGEALDVVLFVAKCSYQKSLVALGLDSPGAYTWFDFDRESGRNVALD